MADNLVPLRYKSLGWAIDIAWGLFYNQNRACAIYGGHVTILCAMCYHVLKCTQVFLERINWFTEEPYEGQARVSHFLELRN